MLSTTRHHVRTLLSLATVTRGFSAAAVRRSPLERSQLAATTPVAEQLAATGLWKAKGVASRTKKVAEQSADPLASATATATTKAKTTRARKSKSPAKGKVVGDKSRVNIVSDKLCQDILNYVGSTLERHKGCDILDIYPGTGVWSSALHDYLKPRTHILLEPDDALYRPFLQPLLEQPGTRIVPKSGIIWRDLNDVLTPEYLPHQTPRSGPQLLEANDTLLVTANLAFHPKKRFHSFDSVAPLVLHQFIDAIRTSSLFQRYGRVRMLIWSRHDDPKGILPKTMQRHKVLAVEGELYCDWIREICGPDELDAGWFTREIAINRATTADAMRRMRQEGFDIPEGRQSSAIEDARAALKSGEAIVPGTEPPVYMRPFQATLEEMESDYEKQTFEKKSPEYKAMLSLRYRANTTVRENKLLHDMLQGSDAIMELYRSAQPANLEIEKLEKDWDAMMALQPSKVIDTYQRYRDNLHYYRQEPRLMHWDRRIYEPMIVQPAEFYPNVPCALLDIYPSVAHPLLRQVGPGSNRAGESFEIIMKNLLAHGMTPVSQLLDSLWPGAADFILPRWESIRNPETGGVPVRSQYAELTPRMLNQRQWEELLELWMEWPFRPTWAELLARGNDEVMDDKDGLTMTGD